MLPKFRAAPPAERLAVKRCRAFAKLAEISDTRLEPKGLDAKSRGELPCRGYTCLLPYRFNLLLALPMKPPVLLLIAAISSF